MVVLSSTLSLGITYLYVNNEILFQWFLLYIEIVMFGLDSNKKTYLYLCQCSTNLFVFFCTRLVEGGTWELAIGQKSSLIKTRGLHGGKY